MQPATTVNPCSFPSLAMFEEVVCADISQLGRPETKCEVAQHVPAKASQAPSPSDRGLNATRCKLSHTRTQHWCYLTCTHTHTHCRAPVHTRYDVRAMREASKRTTPNTHTKTKHATDPMKPTSALKRTLANKEAKSTTEKLRYPLESQQNQKQHVANETNKAESPKQ